MKLDYRCCICRRKPNKDEGYKGWICSNCRATRIDDIKEHYIKLENKRKYKMLEYNFKNIDEVMQEEFVFWNGKLYNRAIIQNWSYHFINLHLSRFNKAILKENDN